MSGIYIPNMTEETAKEHLANFVYVPVPDHGRLIDADALVERICGRNYIEKVLTASKEELRIALTNIPLVINNAPTIIPADKEAGE